MKLVEEKPAQPGVDVKPCVSSFARCLFVEWQRLKLPQAAERVIVAVSGGADSMALLLAFDELMRAERLADSITVAHLDHNLRGLKGREDAQWVAEQAARLGYEAVIGHADVEVCAAQNKDNLEQAARRARYRFLSNVAHERKAGLVLVGHTLDDQAETVLLRLLRGSGAGGLSGIAPVRALSEEAQATLVRPLLRWARREETEAYCRRRNVAVRVDKMNADKRFARVRVRTELIPLLKTFNPRIGETLARTAELLREDDTALEQQAAELLTEASECQLMSESAPPLRIDVLAQQPAAVRRRALRQWIGSGRGDLRRVDQVHLRAVENLLRDGRGGRIAELPGRSLVKRCGRRLYLLVKKS